MGIPRVTIDFIPHAQQRYETAGDWQFTDGGMTLAIRVSELPDAKMMMAVALHELVEAFLCTCRGITDKEVDAFDIEGPGALLDEPGDDPRAPYYNEHQFATTVEESFINELEVDWHEYETALATLTPLEKE